MVNVAQKLRTFYITKVPAPSGYTLFEVLRVTPFPEHFGVVVRLKNQVPSQCRITMHFCSNMPHIGSQREGEIASPEVIAHIFRTIVRHIKRHYFKSRQAKSLAYFHSRTRQSLHLFIVTKGINCLLNRPRRINREMILQCQGAKSFNVIGMLVGDQNPHDMPLYRDPLKGQRPSDGAGRNTGIYEQASLP